MGEICDICGDIGDLEAIIACSRCKIAHEHAYCRKTLCEDVPDVWLCEACEAGSIISLKSVKEDLPKALSPSPQSLVDRENASPSGCNQLLKWENIVKTGKVQYIPAQEAILLSSRAENFQSPSKNRMNSSPQPSKIMGSKSEKTPIKPKVVTPKSSVYVKANPSCRPPGFSTTRQGNKQSNPVVQQQGTESSKDPKEKKAAQAPRKEHVHTGHPMDSRIPAVETKNATAKEEKVVNKPSNELRNFDADNVDQMNMLSKTRKFLRGPALDASWKGCFEVLDISNHEELNDGFHAHPPSKVRRKVYEFSKEMPKVLQFKTLPRKYVWAEIFRGDCPDEDDIGLYFFCSNNQSLLKLIETQDLVMRSHIFGIELLVFTSRLLSHNSQRWNEEHFLWGIFRHVKKYKALCNLVKKQPLIIQSSNCAQDIDDNEDDNVVDMEIDMLSGKDVGKIDSVKSSCGNPKIFPVSRNLDCTVQQRVLEAKREIFSDIPPGFEGAYRQILTSNACTETGRVEKSLQGRVLEASGAGDSDSPATKHPQVCAHTPKTDPKAADTIPISAKRVAFGFGAKLDGLDDERCVKKMKEKFTSTPISKDGCSQSSPGDNGYPQRLLMKIKTEVP